MQAALVVCQPAERDVRRIIRNRNRSEPELNGIPTRELPRPPPLPLPPLDEEPTIDFVMRDGQRAPVPICALEGTPFENMLSPCWQSAAANREVSLHEFAPAAVHRVAKWMAAQKDFTSAAEHAALDDASVIVDVARLCHYMGGPLSPLFNAALQRIGDAMDTTNATSILLLAEQLDAEWLYKVSFKCLLDSFCEVQHRADGCPLPPAVVEKISMMRDCRPPTAASRVPSSLRRKFAVEAAELLAVLDESIFVQTERLEDACERQVEALAAGETYGRAASHTGQLIVHQRMQLAALREYVRRQRRALMPLVDAPAAVKGGEDAVATVVHHHPDQHALARERPETRSRKRART